MKLKFFLVVGTIALLVLPHSLAKKKKKKNPDEILAVPVLGYKVGVLKKLPQITKDEEETDEMPKASDEVRPAEPSGPPPTPPPTKPAEPEPWEPTPSDPKPSKRKCKPPALYIRRTYTIRYRTKNGKVKTFSEQSSFRVRIRYVVRWYRSRGKVRYSRNAYFEYPLRSKYTKTNGASKKFTQFRKIVSQQDLKKYCAKSEKQGSISEERFMTKFSRSFDQSTLASQWRRTHGSSETVTEEGLEDADAGEEGWYFVDNESESEEEMWEAELEPDASNPPSLPEAGTFEAVTRVESAQENELYKSETVEEYSETESESGGLASGSQGSETKTRNETTETRTGSGKTGTGGKSGSGSSETIIERTEVFELVQGVDSSEMGKGGKNETKSSTTTETGSNSAKGDTSAAGSSTGGTKTTYTETTVVESGSSNATPNATATSGSTTTVEEKTVSKNDTASSPSDPSTSGGTSTVTRETYESTSSGGGGATSSGAAASTSTGTAGSKTETETNKTETVGNTNPAPSNNGSTTVTEVVRTTVTTTDNRQNQSETVSPAKVEKSETETVVMTETDSSVTNGGVPPDSKMVNSTRRWREGGGGWRRRGGRYSTVSGRMQRPVTYVELNGRFPVFTDEREEYWRSGGRRRSGYRRGKYDPNTWSDTYNYYDYPSDDTAGTGGSGGGAVVEKDENGGGGRRGGSRFDYYYDGDGNGGRGGGDAWETEYKNGTMFSDGNGGGTKSGQGASSGGNRGKGKKETSVTTTETEIVRSSSKGGDRGNADSATSDKSGNGSDASGNGSDASGGGNGTKTSSSWTSETKVTRDQDVGTGQGKTRKSKKGWKKVTRGRKRKGTKEGNVAEAYARSTT